MSPEMHHLVVGRFGVAGHEVWRAAQHRRRQRERVRRIVRFTWLPVVITVGWIVLARLGLV